MPKFHVTYVVIRTETYSITAANKAAAKELAFSEGDLLDDQGETTDVEELETVLITD